MSEKTAAEPGNNGTEEMLKVDVGGREPMGYTAKLLYLTALAWSLFQVWIASPIPYMIGWGITSDTEARSVHLAFALVLAFLAFPGLTTSQRGGLRLTGWLYVVAAVATLAYATALQFDMAVGTRPIVMLCMGIVFALAAYSSLVPSDPRRIPLADWALALAAGFCALYLFLYYAEIGSRSGRPSMMDLIVTGVGMVTLLEATRRALGPALTIIAVIFLVYTFLGPYMPDLIAHRGASFNRAASQYWLSNEGVFGIALGVSTSFVFLFVLFGALLDRAGAGNYFIQVAFSLLGHLRGGPAKAAVVASGMTGLISGSSIANTVTTGTFTIPLMKRVGFKAEKAGAVEVASSVNGQLMPPVMGAAAFLMVEYVGIPYVEVIRHAFLPAIISYIALIYIVHLEAMKADMKGIPPKVQTPFWNKLFAYSTTVLGLLILSGVVYYGIGWLRVVFGDFANVIVGVGVFAAYIGLLWNASRFPELHVDDPNAPIFELPEPKATINSGLHFILPLVVLIWALIVERLSPGLAAFWAVTFLIFIVLTQRPIMAFFRRRGEFMAAFRVGVWDLLDGMVQGARNMVGIGVATAAAGIIVGTVAMTGVGLVLTEVVETLSGGNLMVMLVMVAMLSLILGLGLPTTANYIIVATLMAPIVVDLGAQSGLIVPLIAVHLFVFYFGIMADVTPPVGLASFAAAAVSRGDPIWTGVYAFYYSLRTVALPFLFIFNTQLLLMDIGGPVDLILTFVSATIAMLVFAAATQGWFVTRSRWYEAAALLLVAFTLFRPGFWMDMIHPEYDQLSATQLEEMVEQEPAGGHLRMWVEGIDAEGRDISKAVMLPLGSDEGSVSDRLQRAGILTMAMGEQVQISNVRFGSQADRLGLDMGMQITGLLVPADRPDRRLFFIPALVLLALIWWIQKRRRDREAVPVTA
ncbi:TRAP transporter 4TM/12TM fusion protein [Natronocella acetinitrilica]|uniref:TRAP transporter 4TM/12TM fusion protein n=1 Tax=Natronocella acetinitrilica TaxID=414046 RepID=A0AAE3G481_9GAMM|nr:TRAP transporter 4TM/12TM fusion protein [Natronocella acetinitrilica]